MGVLLSEGKLLYTSIHDKGTLLDLEELRQYQVGDNPVDEDYISRLEAFLKDCWSVGRQLAKTRPLDLSEGFVIIACMCNLYIKNNRPIKALEIGSLRGSLSFFTMKTAAFLDPKNQVTCVSASPCSDDWQEIMSAFSEEEKQRLSTETTELDNLPSYEEPFDLVVINGYEPVPDAEKVLQEAINAVKDDGIIICIPKNQNTLTRAFRDQMEDFEEYRSNEFVPLFIKHMKKA